ncbi:S8 family serine peptidase, partial [Psittacicella gerlachiana]
MARTHLKTLVSTLASAFTASILVACGGGSSSNSYTSTASSTQSTSLTPTTTKQETAFNIESTIDTNTVSGTKTSIPKYNWQESYNREGIAQSLKLGDYSEGSYWLNALGIYKNFANQTLLSQSGPTIQPINTEGTKGRLTGKGVKVAVFDTNIKKDSLNGVSADSLNMYLFKADGTPVTYADYGSTDYLYAGNNSNSLLVNAHGAQVVSLMAAKQSDNYYGLAPNANYYTFDFYAKAIVSNLADTNIFNNAVYQGIKLSQAKVVNVSFSIFPRVLREAVNKTGKYLNYTNLLSLYWSSDLNPDKSSPYFQNTLNKLYSEDPSNVPLVAVATGNIQYLQDWYVYQRDVLGKTDEFFKAQLNNPLANVMKLEKGNVFESMLENQSSQENLLLVAGVSANNNNVLTDQVKRILQDFVDGKVVKSDNFYDLYNAEIQIEDYETESFANDYNDEVMKSHTNLVASPNAIMCGTAKDHCLVSPYYTTQYDASLGFDLSASGTSFATPSVSAVATYVSEQFPWMTGSQLKTTLLTTAIDLGEEGVDEIYGWGLVYADGAVRGPGQFLSGTTFTADLSLRPEGTANHYYFLNNIKGEGNLEVKGGDSDYLYLVGEQSYSGTTEVKSGNLVLTNSYDIYT